MTIPPERRGTWMMAGSLLVQAVQLDLGPELPRPAYLAIGFVAGFLGMAGASLVARAKGYSQWVGLLGLFSFVGLGIVLGLPEASFLGPALRRAIGWPWGRSSDDPSKP